MPQGLCAHITGLYLIDCIPFTAVQTNDTDLHTAGRICENSSIYREVCVFVGVCWWLCLSSNNETRKYCDRSSADGFICFEVIGSSSGMNKPAQWGTAWFVLGNDFCWVMNWETVEQIGKDLSTGEIKNTRVILSWKPERKRQFRRYRTS